MIADYRIQLQDLFEPTKRELRIILCLQKVHSETANFYGWQNNESRVRNIAVYSSSPFMKLDRSNEALIK